MNFIKVLSQKPVTFSLSQEKLQTCLIKVMLRKFMETLIKMRQKPYLSTMCFSLSCENRGGSFLCKAIFVALNLYKVPSKISCVEKARSSNLDVFCRVKVPKFSTRYLKTNCEVIYSLLKVISSTSSVLLTMCTFQGIFRRLLILFKVT